MRVEFVAGGPWDGVITDISTDLEYGQVMRVRRFTAGIEQGATLSGEYVYVGNNEAWRRPDKQDEP